MKKTNVIVTLCVATTCALNTFMTQASSEKYLQPEDYFELKYVDQIDISDSRNDIYFVKNQFDRVNDKKLSQVWFYHNATQTLQPVDTGTYTSFAPSLSPDQNTLAYIASKEGNKARIHFKDLESGQLTYTQWYEGIPNNLTWSPDNQSVAFTMFVEQRINSPIPLSSKPHNANWAPEPKLIQSTRYRLDGTGYLKSGASQIFMQSVRESSPKQITSGKYSHTGKLSFAKDGRGIYLSAKRYAEPALSHFNTNIYYLDLATHKISGVVEREGPDDMPTVSPDGRYLAFIGYDDNGMIYQNKELYIKDLRSGETKALTTGLDRSVSQLQWKYDSSGIYFSYDNQGKTHLGYSGLKGDFRVLTEQLGNMTSGRPYAGGEFDVAGNGMVAFSLADTQRPPELAILQGRTVDKISDFNGTFLDNIKLGKVEELWVNSGHDNRPIQGWVIYPPSFDKNKKYPLVLEIHGGPMANYGPHFTAELQVLAAKGYVVLYMNPRGSDSYGNEFAQLIHNNFPNHEHDDLTSGVEYLIERGFIDEKRQYVMGGSGGGMIATWMLGKTQRFAAAAIMKPAVNLYSFVLTSDFYPMFTQYWFNGKPWENTAHYLKHSPITYMDNIKTPSLLMTGEADYRTPISETEQFYQALKLQNIDTAMVRMPNMSHALTARPSYLQQKLEYILWWFERYERD
ncbi:S9 family peptidase [Pseudoalteromonas sp. Of7M-16]|uniref:S9 family peptidase n=1 Tax=Pseudoalteromonas sp. Of7M-16 TaxID=2917756 RepID=UPI001EF6264C|nr:S9 family peptidase [Pseudoalteromonas sp. Of7M-16]MCG7546744.1 S9 family peptidase [Pseudoalteromonas sp. Of7M-16]